MYSHPVILEPSSVTAKRWLNEYSHGRVWQRPDGLVARCFGPDNPEYPNFKGCEQCNHEQLILGLLLQMGKCDPSDRGKDCTLRSYAELEGTGE